MSEDDFQEVLDLGEGVYRVKYHRLNVRSLKNMRSRLLSSVFELRNKIGERYEQIEEFKKKLKEKEAMLNKLSDKKINEYIAREQKKVLERVDKANLFLSGYIGEENFKTLQEKGSFEFIGLDGHEYRIKKDGKLQRDCHGYWTYMCMIKPNNLPLPDIIASVFTAATKVEDGLRGSQEIDLHKRERRRDAQ